MTRRYVLTGLLLVSLTTRATGQRVLFTPAISLPTSDAVSLVVRRSEAPAAGDGVQNRRIYVGRLIATRLDTLFIERSKDTVAVAADEVVALRVRHYSRVRERLETGGEVATYGAVIGATAGWLAGVTARALHGGSPKNSAVIGLALGATLGFVGGAASGDLAAGYSEQEVRVSVVN